MADIIHIGQIIHKDLSNQGRTITWFARQLNTSRMACYRIFQSYSIDTQNLYRISILLKKDYFAIYSEKIREDNTV